MRINTCIFNGFVLLLAACLGPEASAQEPADDIEDAPTPDALAELLPAGGIDAVDIDYWLKAEMVVLQGAGTTRTTYIHRSIKQEDGRLVLRHRRLIDSTKLYDYDQRVIYAPDGRFVSYVATYRTAGEVTKTTTAELKDDQVVTRVTGRGQLTTDEHIALADYEPTLYFHRLPLIYAYHIRRGNLGYRLSYNLTTDEQNQTALRVEDLGTEQVEHKGQPATAHLLAVRSTTGRDDKQRTRRTTMLVLKTGEAVRMEERTPTLLTRYTPITREQVEAAVGPIDPEDDAAEQE